MITAAAASAQSAFGLPRGAESEIKTIVQTGLCPGYSDRHRILPGAEPSPLSKFRLEKNIELPPCQRLPSAGIGALAGQGSQIVSHFELSPQLWLTTKLHLLAKTGLTVATPGLKSGVVAGSSSPTGSRAPIQGEVSQSLQFDRTVWLTASPNWRWFQGIECNTIADLNNDGKPDFAIGGGRGIRFGRGRATSCLPPQDARFSVL